MKPTILACLFVLSVRCSLVIGDEPRTISVIGRGEAEIEPDSAQIEMAVEFIDRDARNAKRQVDKTMSAILGVVNEFQIAKGDVSATQLRVAPEYQYSNDRYDLIGYKAERAVSVTLRVLPKLDELLNACIDAGVIRVDDITLKASKEKELKDQVVSLAIDDAKERARVVAAGFGVRLGKVRTISTDSRSYAQVMSLSAPIEGLSGGAYLSAKIDLRSEIGVVFELK